MPFPTSFPVVAIPAVIGYLRNAGVSRRTAAEAAYDLLGYGANLALPEDNQSLFSVSRETGYESLSDAFLAVRLEEFKADVDANPQASINLPPWMVPLLLEVIRRILS